MLSGRTPSRNHHFLTENHRTMFGVKHIQAPPTTYVMQYRRGSVVRQGAGLSFFYFAPTSTIVRIPLASADVPFVHSEATADFQEITIQSELTYHVAKPRQLAALLDFSVDAEGRYRSADPSKLDDRLTHAAQMLVRAFTQKHRLRDLLVGGDLLVDHVLSGLKTAESVTMMGVEILAFSVLSMEGQPEMVKALQADALQRRRRREAKIPSWAHDETGLAPSPTGNRVLVVEDDEVTGELASNMLERHGFDVLVATTAQDAMDAVMDYDPAVILMDVHLGDVNGIELVKRMRRAHIGPDVPVIVVTSDRIRETVLDAMAADVQGYLLKPYQPRILADKVGAVLEKWKAELPRA